MPTYQYRCSNCDDQFELRQSFTDDPVTVCPDQDCAGPVKKVFGSVGIAFKGSGFYKNDSRPSETNKSSDSSTSKDSDKTSSTSPSDKPASSEKPAEKPSKPESSTPAKD
jgi:putative FmdB family regulatory protein|tara:strand:+ start:404 stop:733 length:330 start_codon:yes stop_codon:yes gene_type:complete